ncbi:MAG TPA: hypothetical protein VNW15_15875 [Rhizomicrobium sp.]|nr:hypothetical protein [Rhizomicrobium sp.]
MSALKKISCAAAMLALCAAPASARSILFLGSSFTYGAHTAVQHYRPETVHDLNGPDARGDTYGGVPAIFKQFTLEAGLTDYDVSSELVGGKGLEYWFTVPETLARIQKPWDIVVMHGFSTLDQAHPNDRTLLLSSSKRIAQMFLKENPQSKLWLFATWSRADMTYPDGSPWHGKPIQQMGKDVEAGYEQAVKEEPRFAGIVPVGLAWNRAIDTGIADDNPYDDVGASKMDLWAYDHYHASVFGYYLEALMDFGRVTGLDPMVLSGKDKVAEDIGISPAQSKALIQVAHDTLAAAK